jgi:hypothetical protein
LSYNLINKIGAKAFVNLTNVNLNVELQNNQLELLSASENFLRGLPGVNKLVLTNNQIEKSKALCF